VKLHTPYTIDGVPILGTYVAQTVDVLEKVRAVGMNCVIGGKQDLDVSTETGRYCYENGIKILYHMRSHPYGKPRLQAPITAGQTTIPLQLRDVKGFFRSGVVQIDGELIRYSSTNGQELLGCERGADGTEAAPHREGVILFWPEEFAEEVREVKDSPNLYGYYVLDDSPGDALSALKGMYRVIREIDPVPQVHPVLAGYGSAGSLCNFGPGVCDIMLVYWYPVSGEGYDRHLTSQHMQWMMAAARMDVPGIPFVGVYQSFDACYDGTGSPTAEQLREQIDDFVREGASGLVSFLAWHGEDGWAGSDYMMRVITEVNEEIRETGGLSIAPESDEMKKMRVQPTGFWEATDETPGVVPAYHVLSLFEDVEGKKIDSRFPPDGELNFDATYEGKSGPIRWHKRLAYGGILGIGELHGPHTYTMGTVTYATCTVTSPVEQTVEMRIGTDDDGIVWLNGEQVFRFDGGRGIARDLDLVQVTLPAGESRILAKVYNRKGMTGFFLRFCDTDGEPLDGLMFSPPFED